MTGLESNGARPDASQLTVRFKSGKTTILLFVSPTDEFSAIKGELLRALTDTGIKEVNGAPLPKDAADIELAVLANRNDPSQGWVALEDAPPASASASKKTKIADSSPQAADLKDNAMLAFRFPDHKEEWDVHLAVLEDLDVEGGEDMDQN